jgi:ribose-phosphate pyrophosphokinase
MSESNVDEPRAPLSSVTVVAGPAHPMLALAVARELALPLAEPKLERFPDGEIHVEVDPRSIEGRAAFIVQPTSSPASDHLVELLLMSDACLRAGAASVSAVVPYFGYARQDRSNKPGEALGARVMAHVLGAARLEHVVAIDVHGEVVEASLDVLLEHLSAVPLLAEAVSKETAADAIVVAPDLGAVRLAREYSRLLRLPLAVVHKVRRSSTHVDVERVAGDVRGLEPLLVDDMVATGGTIVAAAHALENAGAKREIVVAATHPVLTPGALSRLREAGLRRLVVTDTIPLQSAPPSVTLVSVAPLLARCVRRIRRGRLG